MLIFFEHDHLLILAHMEMWLHWTGVLWWQVTDRESPDSSEPSRAEAQLYTGTTAHWGSNTMRVSFQIISFIFSDWLPPHKKRHEKQLLSLLTSGNFTT